MSWGNLKSNKDSAAAKSGNILNGLFGVSGLIANQYTVQWRPNGLIQLIKTAGDRNTDFKRQIPSEGGKV